MFMIATHDHKSVWLSEPVIRFTKPHSSESLMIRIFFITDEFCQQYFDMIPLTLSTLVILRKIMSPKFTSLKKVLIFLFAMFMKISQSVQSLLKFSECWADFSQKYIF